MSLLLTSGAYLWTTSSVLLTRVAHQESKLGWIKYIVIVSTEASKQLPTQDTNQEGFFFFFFFEKEMFIWRTALQYRYSSIVNSDIKIKFEINDFDSDNAPLDLIHLAKTAPPELTTTVVYSVITQSWWP